MKTLVSNANTFQWQTSVSPSFARGHQLWPKQWQRPVPGSIVALVLGTAAVAFFSIRSKPSAANSAVSPGAARFRCPRSRGRTSSTSSTIRHDRVLAAIESLLCAVVADGMVDDRHDSNQELMAQGLANIISPLFGGIAATGAIARTATNVKSGARTPIAGMIHAVTLLGIIMAAAPLAKFIPSPLSCACLVNVAVAHGRVAQLSPDCPNGPAASRSCSSLPLCLTVVIDLTVAVEIGMVLAAVLFIKRASETMQITAVDESTDTEGSHHSLKGKDIPKGVLVYRMFGAFFFGAADKLESALKREKFEPEVLILRMRKVLAMDATGLNALEDLFERLRRKGKHVILSGPHTQPLLVMDKAGFLDRIGRENVCADIDAGLARARELLGLPPVVPKPARSEPTALEPSAYREVSRPDNLRVSLGYTSSQRPSLRSHPA